MGGAGNAPGGGWPVHVRVRDEQFGTVFEVDARVVGPGVHKQWDCSPDVQSRYLDVGADVGASQVNRILKNNGGRGAGFRSSTTSTAFNLCWTRRIQPQQPQIQTLVVASK